MWRRNITQDVFTVRLGKEAINGELLTHSSVIIIKKEAYLNAIGCRCLPWLASDLDMATPKSMSLTLKGRV